MDLTGTCVAVTGASGFLGGHVVEALCARGASVRAVVRRPRAARGVAAMGATVVRADLNDEAALGEAFDGVDAVVANAALYSIDPRPWGAFVGPNVRGTEHLMRAAAGAGVAHVVHVSSTAAYGERTDGPLPESAPLLTEDDRDRARPYAVSKAVAERLAWTLAERWDLPLTTVRPCSMYGSRDRHLMPKLASYRRWPVLPVPDDRRPFVHARDVGDAVAVALGTPGARGRAYNLAPPPVRLSVFLSTWARVTGRGPVLLPVPIPRTFSYDSRRAERELGFRPRSLESGLAEAIEGGIAPRR